MESAVVVGMPAVEARERLVAFVEEMTAGLSLARQRENGLLYIRSLIEHGGRKSGQPTLLRLGEDAARYSRCRSSSPTRPGIQRCS